MALTKEQQAVIDELKEEGSDLVLVSAVAGSGKTFTIIEAVKALNPKHGRYLAYNKKIVEEVLPKLNGTNVGASTIHSMAYQAVISRNNPLVNGKKRHIGSFREYVIRRHFPSLDQFQQIKCVTEINKFCLSKYTSFHDYVDYTWDNDALDVIIEPCVQLLRMMKTGEIACTHEFYLKLYHLLLKSGGIKPPEEDLIIIDEFGDITEVSLEIFMLLPAKKKLVAGDERQAIYTFAGTVNGFERLKGQGVLLGLTKTFRVSAPIAEAIQKFCNLHIDPDMKFIGVDIPDDTIESRMYITRGNSQLIGKIIELNNQGQDYILAREADRIFELLITLLFLKPGREVFSKDYKFLEKDAMEWDGSAALKLQYKSLRGYIASKHSMDVSIKSAITILAKYSAEEILEAKRMAKEHETKNLESARGYVLGTSFSLKGLQSDHVEIADDLNNAVEKVLAKKPHERSADDKTMLLLYYVAVSRVKKKLINAKFIDVPLECL